MRFPTSARRNGATISRVELRNANFEVKNSTIQGLRNRQAEKRRREFEFRIAEYEMKNWRWHLLGHESRHPKQLV